MGERQREGAVTSCCPGKQLDGLGCCHLRREDGEKKGENKKSGVESHNRSLSWCCGVLHDRAQTHKHTQITPPNP